MKAVAAGPYNASLPIPIGVKSCGGSLPLPCVNNSGGTVITPADDGPEVKEAAPDNIALNSWAFSHFILMSTSLHSLFVTSTSSVLGMSFGFPFRAKMGGNL
jgi:hypothetical protein